MTEHPQYKFTCRLNGIDAPEMKPLKSKNNRENEILMAKKARAELLKLICPNSEEFDNLDIKKEDIIKELSKNKQLIKVKCCEFDKYGRLLVELYSIDDNTESFNKKIINKHLAVEYDGGKKTHAF